VSATEQVRRLHERRYCRSCAADRPVYEVVDQVDAQAPTRLVCCCFCSFIIERAEWKQT